MPASRVQEECTGRACPIRAPGGQELLSLRSPLIGQCLLSPLGYRFDKLTHLYIQSHQAPSLCQPVSSHKPLVPEAQLPFRQTEPAAQKRCFRRGHVALGGAVPAAALSLDVEEVGGGQSRQEGQEPGEA